MSWPQDGQIPHPQRGDQERPRNPSGRTEKPFVMIAGRRFGPSKTTPSKSRLFAVVGALALFTVAGCAETAGGPFTPPPPAPLAPPPPPAAPAGIVIVAPFKADDFAWPVRPGTARIQGLTAKGASCAGHTAALTPATPYSRERIVDLYGSGDYAIVPIAAVRAKVFANDNPAMRGYVRAASCDQTGTFVFDKLPAGPYFIIA